MQHTPPPHMLTGVSVALFKDNAVLLTLRGKHPYKGYWSLPGGLLEAEETLERAARRELAEETSLQAEVLHFLEFFEPLHDSSDDEPRYVLGVFVCKRFRGEARAGDDAAEVQWRPIDTLSGIKITPGTTDCIMRAKRLCDTQS